MQLQTGNVDTSIAVFINSFDIGAGINQQFHQRIVALRHCQNQRRLSPVVQWIDTTQALIEQQLGQLIKIIQQIYQIGIQETESMTKRLT